MGKAVGPEIPPSSDVGPPPSVWVVYVQAMILDLNMSVNEIWLNSMQPYHQPLLIDIDVGTGRVGWQAWHG